MRAECGELKRGYGECRFTPETLDDLWHLSHLVVPGALHVMEREYLEAFAGL